MLQRGDKPVSGRHGIPEMNIIVNCKGPEIFLCLLGPMKDKVKKRGSRPVKDGL